VIVLDEQLLGKPKLLRALLRRAEFRTKASRMGKVIRVSDRQISYYTARKRAERLAP
jgi:hypothetical protein